ncbi:MAG: family hydrolase [Anaerocolumna sp.]|nr:family hydrolase [Anaerocolumna sp.]
MKKGCTKLRYEAIIFDVSDTLIEYSPNYAQIFGDRLRSLGFTISEEKAREVSKAVNMTICVQSQKEQEGEPHISEEELNKLLDTSALSCIMNNDIDISNCVKKLESMKLPKQEMNVIQGVFEVLDILKKKYRLAIVSNHYAWLNDYLNSIGLSQYFESIIISENVGVAKPSIKIMQIALKELSIDAKKCLYVGDQPFDVLCSKRAGMDCAWIAPDNISLPSSIIYKEDYKISKLSDLLTILY